MSSSGKPNVIFVLTDDQGYGDLGCHGDPIIQTPNLDSFYNESVRFTDFHVGPTCAPTRAGLMTGHYANSTGVWHTIGGRSLLRRHEWTLASALAEQGYRTAIFGKWHLGDAYPYRPNDRGFQHAIVHGGGGISQTPDYWGNDYFDDTYFVNGEPKRFEGYCTDVFFREALGFIKANRDAPFFCYIASNAPHGPLNVEPKYFEMYKEAVPEDRARFYGMITNIDENFGMLRSKLQEWGLEENTILIFMTDNGTATGVTLNASSFVTDGFNAGMRGMKGSPYDGGHRVPFFIRWPAGGITGPRDVNELAMNVDFMPTLIELCGINTPANRSFHGTSLAPLLQKPAEPWPQRVMVTHPQRLANPVKWRLSAVMTNEWRLVNGRELYRIKDDPEQRYDVAAEYPEVVKELRAAYEDWWDIVSQQFDEEIPITLGGSPGQATVLTCHDWHNEDCDCPWNQGHIRAGHISNGYWEVRIEQDGAYEVELRRWPREGERAITRGIEGDDVEWRRESVPERSHNWYTGGNALDVTTAQLRIGSEEWSRSIDPAATCVVFRVHLKQGRTHLHAWLSGENGLEVGAYYVYVRGPL